MSTLFINALESKLKQKLDLDKLEIFDFKVSINNLYQAFLMNNVFANQLMNIYLRNVSET